ncbi:MAG: sigma 54-interacting transcriptional regulator [Methylococcales bacterium]
MITSTQKRSERGLELLPIGSKHGSNDSKTDPHTARTETLLRLIMEGTAKATGKAFFSELVCYLALTLGVRYAFVSEFTRDKTRGRTLAFWADDGYMDEMVYLLKGTPCESVLLGNIVFYPQNIQAIFPDDCELVKLEAVSYLAVPLIDRYGTILGLLGAMNNKPMNEEPNDLSVFKIFAARAAAEIERIRAEDALQASEKQFRDLYEEAPIAYLSTGVDGKIKRANRHAMEWFGYTEHDLVGRDVLDLVADTAAGKPMADKVFSQFLEGEETQGQEIEMRQANGESAWASVSLRPIFDQTGRVVASRSMLVNITDRKLAEEAIRELRTENISLQEEINRPFKFKELVGDSTKMQVLYNEIELVADTGSTVLIVGETGTGKELIARALHNASSRKDKILVKINCAALPSELIESELFGHEKGAFTGATQQRKGRFELADKGTIFLDEVGELSPQAQAKLLRVLQEQEFERVGGATTIKVDARIIAATNRDLTEMVNEGTFRLDLYYRINVFPLQVPSLRERISDVPQLARYFLALFGRKLGRAFADISPTSMENLQLYHWPGNVRELQNIIERAAILAKGQFVEIVDTSISQLIVTSMPIPSGSLGEVERNYILQVLETCGWVVEGKHGAATILDIKPSTLRFRMQKLAISKSYRSG